MKRIGHFFYYLWALLWPHQDVNIWSVGLAWKLAGIAASWPSVDDPPRGPARLVVPEPPGYQPDDASEVPTG